MRIVEFLREEPYLVARVQRVPEVVEESVEVDALTRNTLELFQRLVALVAHMPDELVTAALNVDDPRHLVSPGVHRGLLFPRPPGARALQSATDPARP